MAARHSHASRRGRSVIGPLVVVTLLALVYLWWTGNDQPADEPAPEPPAAEAPAPAPQQEAPYIADSRPLEMYIPAIGLVADFERIDCRAHVGSLDPSTVVLYCA